MQASRSCSVGRIARHAITPSWRDTPTRRFAWRHCAEVLWRSSRAPSSDSGRSRARRAPVRASGQSPRAPRRTDTASTRHATKGIDAMVACRRPPGTTGFQPLEIPPPRTPRLHSTVQSQSSTRTAAAPCAAQCRDGLASVMPPAQTDQIVVSVPPSHPPSSSRCDDRLNPPCTPRSL